MPDPVTDLTRRLLNQSIDVIPRYRLLRDVLHESHSSRQVQEARIAAMSSPQVAWLAAEQHSDGSWGHFQRGSSTNHEYDTVAAGHSVRQAVRSTDAALRRASFLGMDRQHPVMQKALAYLENLFDGSLWMADRCADLSEYVAKSDNMAIRADRRGVAKRDYLEEVSDADNIAKRDTYERTAGVEYVAKRDMVFGFINVAKSDKLSDSRNVAKRDTLVAARIRLFDEENPFALQVADRWKQILSATFDGGTYHELRYLESYEDLFGQPADRSQNLAFSRSVLELMRGLLPYPIEEAYTRHIMEEVRGIVGVHHRALHHLPLDFPSLESLRFLSAIELLAVYPSAEPFLEETKTWLWEQMSPSGRWDLGKSSHDGVFLPLSPNWRRSFDREVDSSVRMLLLLQNMQISCDLRQNLCHTR